MSAKDNPVEHLISGVPLYGGPEDGNFDDGTVMDDGEMIGRFYPSLHDELVHVYQLTFNNDDGYRFLYSGLRKVYQNDSGDLIVEEEDDGK